MIKKDRPFLFRISENMLEALREKLNGTGFNLSLVMRASVSQLLNMGHEDMIKWIDIGAKMTDKPSHKQDAN